MPKNKRGWFSSRKLLYLVSGLAFALATPMTWADTYTDQINSLNTQNSQTQATIDALSQQAGSYQAEIAQLNAQISGVEAAISTNQTKQAQVEAQIQSDQTQIAQNKALLGNVIKTMYIGGQVSTTEMLATSNSISAFVDAETYRSAVGNEVQNLLSQIATLKAQQEQQDAQLKIVINTESQQNNQLASAESQQQQFLSYNQGQQAAYNAQVQVNQQKISLLQQEQVIANEKLISNGNGSIDAEGSCGGGYPAEVNGTWGCDFGLDASLDSFGMDNRECVSYTAWMVYETYGYKVTWGFEDKGNANQWPGDAAAAGIPIGTTPKVGSVAIYMGGSGDPFGHAMWVQSVNGNGTITVQQYNLEYDGNYYQTTISSAGLIYIYFGG
ncbi:MAG TPA: CHAP domain-containing protein [Candidatus Saccharimonadales bacterium]|nr:CHAP domain-containing protein [Candidatus Saccharimonadales bacterium]